VSNAQYSNYLNEIKLNPKFVNFTKLDLNYLNLDIWNKLYINNVKNSEICTPENFEIFKKKNIENKVYMNSCINIHIFMCTYIYIYI
jgi:hypothetical protein